MSVLRNRVLYQDEANNVFQADRVRWSVTGLPTTVRVMPLALVHYDLEGQITYSEAHPYFNTGDVNAAPIPATDNGRWDQVVATGRP